MPSFFGFRKTEGAPTTASEIADQQETNAGSGILRYLNRIPASIRVAVGGLMLWQLSQSAGADLGEKYAMPSREPKQAGAAMSRLPSERIQMDQESQQEIQKKWQWPSKDWTFFEKDEAGQRHFNWWSLMFPVQPEIARNLSQVSQEEIYIPYTWSRLFDAGKEAKMPLRPEDHEKTAHFLEQELQQRFADILRGVSKNVYKSHREGAESTSNLKIIDLQIIGTASPEGHEAQGPDTIKSGNIEPENIALARARGETGAALLGEGLKKLNASPEIMQKVREAANKVQTQEIQFTDEELKELAKLAQDQPGADDLEKIFNLIIDYNENKISPAQAGVIAKLDQIVGSKRHVEIIVTYEGQQKEVWMMPLPWLVLLPLLWPAFRRRKREAVPEQTEEKLSPIEETPQPETLPLVRETKLPSSATLEYQKMEVATTCDDLSLFLDAPRTKQRGLDYREMADELLKKYDSFPNDEERELFLTNMVLEQWKQHDILCRKEAGFDEKNLSDGLDYEKQPEQIKWAKMHAKVLHALVKDKRQSPDQDYVIFLMPKRRSGLYQRIFSQGEKGQ